MKNRIGSTEFFSVEVDDAKNRMYTTFHGFWKEMSIMDDYRTNLHTAIKRMKANFTLVADLRDFKTLPPELIPKQKQCMEDLAKGGMFKVAVILPASAISGMQLKKSMTDTNMPERQFGSVADGEKWLDNAAATL